MNSADQIFQFVFHEKTGKLTANTPPVLQLKPNTGRRHLVVSQDNRFVYLHLDQQPVDDGPMTALVCGELFGGSGLGKEVINPLNHLGGGHGLLHVHRNHGPVGESSDE
jgi:hypothetical protein